LYICRDDVWRTGGTQEEENNCVLGSFKIKERGRMMAETLA